jgi:hypothetical protein
MQTVHPEVIAFWEKKGYTVKSREGHDFGMFWDIVKGSAIFHTITQTFIDRPNIYYWDNKEYSEEQIVRIIRMKAFA